MFAEKRILEFHVHVDACEITPPFSARLDRLGFDKAPFIPVNSPSYAPDYHYTKKFLDPTDNHEFLNLFNELKDYWKHYGGARGYIEGECITEHYILPAKEFDSTVPIPFRVKTRKVGDGKFRESEIHITLNRDASDPVLQQNLLDMGFYLAANRKDYGVAHIYTIQGFRKDIEVLMPAVLKYIEQAGGAVNCKIKEEKIARWYVSDTAVELPPIIDVIDWT